MVLYMNRSGPRSNHLVFHFCPHLFPRLILGRMEDEDGDDGSQSRRVFTGLKAARGQTFQSGAWRCGAQAVPPAMITSLLTSTVYTRPRQK